VYLREIQGLQVNSDVKAAFDEKYIKELEDEKNVVTIDHHVKHIFVTVDPNAGGKNSNCAVISSVYQSGTMIVSASVRNSFTFFALFMYSLHR
jgi:hypothetical protein